MREEEEDDDEEEWNEKKWVEQQTEILHWEVFFRKAEKEGSTNSEIEVSGQKR